MSEFIDRPEKQTLNCTYRPEVLALNILEQQYYLEDAAAGNQQNYCVNEKLWNIIESLRKYTAVNHG